MKTWYLTGSERGDRALYNKLNEFVGYSSAYLYAPESVRFGIALPPHYGDQWMDEAAVAREELHRLWHDSDAGLIFGMGVTWSHVWDTVVFKVLVSQNEAALTMVPAPSDVGLLHEELDWDTQEAICHWYVLDLARFRRLIDPLPDDRRERLMALAEAHATPSYESMSETMPPTMQRLLVAASSPSMIGNVQGESNVAHARPRVGDKVVRLAELWVKDDAAKDYRVVTNFTHTEEIIWEPLNPLNPGEHPFHNLTLNPTPGYAWGVCPLEYLVSLQAAREMKLAEVNERDELQLDPPMFFKNFSMLDGEKAKAFRKKGGNIVSSQPNSEVTSLAPPPLPDPLYMVDHIDSLFSRQGALPRGMVGQTEAGVRSGEQAMAQAMLGAGPTMIRAMLVEDTLESIATSMMRLHRRVNDTTLRKPNGEEFLLSQMPGDFVARVWAHSASPLYQQHLLQKATLAKQMKVIDAEDFLEFLDLPMTDTRLKAKARKIAEAQAKQGERVMEIKEQEAKAKLEKAQRR
jgi:hypothetical protein